MTRQQRLALLLIGPDENIGDDQAAPFEVVDSDDELMRWLKVSNRFAQLERRVKDAENIINRITTRFATDGRPLPEVA